MKPFKLLFFLLTLSFTPLYGADVLWNHRLEGSSIHNGNITVVDPEYGQLGTGSFIDVQDFGYIRLGLGERVGTSYLSGLEHYKVHLKITPYNNSGVVQSVVYVDLEADYSNLEGGLTVDADDYRMLGIHKYLVEVEWIEKTVNNGTPVQVTNLQDYIYLEAGFSSTRYYNLNVSQVPVISHNFISYASNGAASVQYNQGSTPTVQTTDELELSWGYVDGAELYELEWTWVDSYSGSSLGTDLTPSQIALTEEAFRRNSTRIRTGAQSYRIPQVFAKGYVIYRVRGVGRWLTDVSRDKFGAWSGSSATKTTVADWSNVITIGASHEGLKNWQYSATYAEGGKKKEVTQYYDGSLRQRQVVTRLNSDNHSVVGETIYDNEGRGTIQVLPVPQANPSLKYYGSLNQNMQGVPYSYEDFDLESTTTTTCEQEASGAMLSTSGASAYYSPGGHSSDTDWQQYVPDAKGYPYTQVEYTPDNTGRVRSQSGVGDVHKLGSNHQTMYYYLQPSQAELDRLFGYKVGYKQRYKKNLVIDANGQVSVSYLDAAGKVVATALQGDNTTSFTSLASEQDGVHGTLSTDVLNKISASDPNTSNDDNDLISTGRFGSEYDGLTSGTQLVVTQDNSLYQFTYTAQTSYFAAACSESGMNYPFVYDLHLSLRDDCGHEYFSHTYEAVGEEAFNSTVTDFVNLAESVTLQSGAYTVYKEITVNEASLLAYKTDYLNSTCILSEGSFSDAVDTDCNETCSECLANLGSLEDYLAAGALELGHPLDANEELARTNVYNSLKEACVEPCRMLSSCDVYAERLAADFRPQGQYGGLTPTDKLSIFNEDNDLRGDWRDGVYTDEYGNAAYVAVTFDGISYSPPLASGVTPPASLNGNQAGEYYVLPTQLANVSDFIAAFDPAWSSNLIQYHPEYRLYEYAQDICTGRTALSASSTTTSDPLMLSSEEFDNMLLNQMTTYALANSSEVTQDGLNYYTLDILDQNSSNGGLYGNDPYFQQTYPKHAWLQSQTTVNITQLKQNLMLEALNNNPKFGGMSMLAYAVHTVINGGLLSPGPITATNWSAIENAYTTAQVDAIWQTYKSYYVSSKRRIDQLLMDVYGFKGSETVVYNFPLAGSVTLTNVGVYNGAIGSGGVGTGVMPYYLTNPTSSYSSTVLSLVQQTYLHSYSGLTIYGTPFSSTYGPIALAGSGYNTKEICITRFEAISNPAIPESVLLAETAQQGDYAQWASTGLCGLMLDVEHFLNDRGVNGTLTTGGDAFGMATFTQDMFTGFSGSSAVLGSQMSVVPSISSGSLTLQFSSLSPTSSQSIVLPQIGSYSWSNYGTAWHIYGIYHSYPVPNTNNVKVIVRAGTDLGSSLEYVITYQSSVNLNSCQTDYVLNGSQYDPSCDKEEQFEGAILDLLQELSMNNSLNSSSSVNISNYSSYVNSPLGSYLGFNPSTPTYWYNVSGTWIISNGSRSFSLGNGYSSMNSITSFSIFNGQVYLSGMNSSDEYDTLVKTYSFMNGDSPLVLDLSCPCGEAQTEEAALAAYLTYVYTHSPLACGSQPAELLALQPYLPFTSPSLYSVEILGGGRVLHHAELGTDCSEGATVPTNCDWKIVSTSNFVSVSDVVLTEFGFSFIGHLSNGSTESVTVRTPCLSTAPCEDCLPQVQEPVSCTDAYSDYWTYMHSQFPYSGSDLTIFEEEYLVSAADFCENQYAYIWSSYQTYLTSMSVTDVTDVHFISIGSFGNTPMGYSNVNLTAAVSAYVSYVGQSGNEGVLWKDYIMDTYMVLHPELCPASMPPVTFPLPGDPEPCNLWGTNIASVNQQNQYALYLAEVGAQFEKDYLAAALSSLVETFTESHADKEYHYTLYYYDRSGNLIQTVPPQGVDRLEVGEASTLSYSDIDNLRLSGPTETANTSGGVKRAPEHSMNTVYRYNSLNQLVFQSTPDGGESYFAYDRLGRLVLSQNAQQKQSSPQRFSYTTYDALGRVVEAGEMEANASTYAINDLGGLSDNGVAFTGLTGVNAPNFPVNLASSRKEVTRTIYDELQTAASGVVTVPVQSGTANVSSLFASYSAKNTRNRIVGVIYQAVYNVSMNSYNHATFYDYDVHGNVKELLQVQVESGLVALNQHIKHLVYDYDLVSGNVNKVTYQKGYSDQFIHRYSYDDDNRITHVETSRDGVYYEKDAKYFYYDHGPLARTELGDKKVTTQDYAYTIQGWIKSVNGEDTKPLTMMGADGVSGLNAQVGRDVYGYSLSYYDGDYNAANTSMLTYSGNTTEQGTLGASLYNGNIRAMYTELSHSNQSDLKTHRSVYTYDQLNRIKSMTGAYRTWSGGVTGGDVSGYASNYSFDDNGNLLSLQRFIDQSTNQSGVSQAIDDLSYTYYKYDPLNPLNPPTEYTPMPNLTGLQGSSNQLAYVDDALGADPMGVGHSVMGADIAGQSSGNYAYDEIGRLIKDVKEGISNIAWTVTNKVKTITKSGMTISFEYDAMGHRVAKKVDHTGGDYEYTFYVLDAQGNTMTTYSRKKGGNNDEKLYLADRSIYGSSRLGLEDVGDLEMTLASLTQPVYDIARNQNKVGDKQYELSNHLGNVLNVVADRKIATDDGTYNNGTFVSATLDGIVDYYTADILTHSDYFPYGMQLPNRKGQQTDAYRYGFNGMESDKEIKGEGNSYDYGARMLDPRVGRWLSVDEIIHHGMSPYNGSDNNPIYFNDEDGNNAVGKIKYNKDGSIKKITAKAVINFYGGGASDKVAKSIASDIQSGLNANQTSYYDPVAQKNVPIEFKIKGKNVSIFGARVRILGNKIFGGMKQNFIRIEKAEELKDKETTNDEGGSKETQAFMISYGNNDPSKEVEVGGNSGFFTLEAVFGASSHDHKTAQHEFVHGLGYQNPLNTIDYAHSSNDKDLMFGSGAAADQDNFNQKNLQLINSSAPISIAKGRTRFTIGSGKNNRVKFIRKDGTFRGQN